jgi:hypothetical protein
MTHDRTPIVDHARRSLTSLMKHMLQQQGNHYGIGVHLGVPSVETSGLPVFDDE